MGNASLTCVKYDWLGEGRGKVKTSWATFTQEQLRQHPIKSCSGGGHHSQRIDDHGIELSELVALWLEQYELSLLLGNRVRSTQRKRPFSPLVLVEYSSEQRIVSGDLYCEVKVVIDPRSLELHECTMLRKHN